MARTTAELVGGIVDIPDSVDVTPFIDTANQMVTDCCADAGYTDAKLELIERWLSAHFYRVAHPSAETERKGPFARTLNRKLGYGLDCTVYGQNAMRLDTEGGLAELDQQTEDGGSNTGVFWAGTEFDEEE